MIRSRALVYLDSNIFIDAIEGDAELAIPAQELLRRLQELPGVAITSELTLAEVLAPRKSRGNEERAVDPDQKTAYLDLLIWSRFIVLKAVTRDILLQSAECRALHKPKLKLPDAIHLVTADQERCGVFVTRDAGIRPPAGMRQMQPDRDGAPAIIEAVR